MQPIKALSFDLNDTLVDTSGVHEAVVRTCRELAQVGLDPAQLLDANRAVWRAYWPQVEQHWTLGALDGEAVSLEAWRRTLRACGCDDEDLVQRARAAHRRHMHQLVRLFDDVHDLLSWARGAGLWLALVTNGAADSQRDALRGLGIEHQFAAVIISGEIRLAKPDPAIFAVAVDRLGLAPENVWHVGDNVKADIAGARAAGLTAVWLNRRGVRREQDHPLPDHEVRSLHALIELLSARIESSISR